jgi:uncharacterized protein
VPGTTFFWDFFGPRAEGTARHFQRHMDEFLHRETLAGCITGAEQLAAGHWAAWCRAPADAAAAVQGALRPRRQREEE